MIIISNTFIAEQNVDNKYSTGVQWTMQSIIAEPKVNTFKAL